MFCPLWWAIWSHPLCLAISSEFTKHFYLCWTLIGLPILVGPLIAVARFLQAFNYMAQRFNSEHTFPLSEEEINAVVPLDEEHRPRKSIIEQIITPEEEEPLRLDDEEYQAYADSDALQGPEIATENANA